LKTVKVGIPMALHFILPKARFSARKLWWPLLLSGSFVWAQYRKPSSTNQRTAKVSKEQVTVQGCVSRSTGDYILIKQDPGMTYELQPTGKTRLRQYLGQEVEVTGTESPSLSTSSDALARLGSPASVTLTITSIRTIAKQCRLHRASDK